MTMPAYPAARLLVPATPGPLPDDFQVVETRLLNGLPHLIDLGGNLRLKLMLPSGLLQSWLDVDPASLVASSGDETRALPATPGEEVGGCARPPLRVMALQAGAARATVAMALGARRLLPDSGHLQTGAQLELVFLEWKIHAGTICGSGDFGSYLKLAWRPANLAIDVFGPPVINPFLWVRLLPVLRIESDLGLRLVRADQRFILRRLALHG